MTWEDLREIMEDNKQVFVILGIVAGLAALFVGLGMVVT